MGSARREGLPELEENTDNTDMPRDDLEQSGSDTNRVEGVCVTQPRINNYLSRDLNQNLNSNSSCSKREDEVRERRRGITGSRSLDLTPNRKNQVCVTQPRLGNSLNQISVSCDTEHEVCVTQPKLSDSLNEILKAKRFVCEDEDVCVTQPTTRISLSHDLENPIRVSRRGTRILAFPFRRTRPRPRQPFMGRPVPANQPQRPIPAPPSYYRNAMNSRENRNTQSATPPSDKNESSAETSRDRREVLMNNAFSFQPGVPAVMPDIMFSLAYWAPYPDNIPENVPACLAHLVAADSLFIIQRVDIIQLITDAIEPNFYLIQNKNGQCIYYVYETTNFNPCLCCCSNARNLQLHVMDMYHNEIIYMNRPCGCNNWCCCYPVMEVYSPPMIAVGAIIQTFRLTETMFSIVDADENLMFKIHGPCCLGSCCFEVEFTIHALDQDETEVGIIRRQFAGYTRAFYTDADYFGITFPKDLDVRIKAVFLAALFLIVSAEG